MPAPDTNPDVSVLASAPDLEEWHLDLDAHRADDAVSVLRRLGDFRGESSFRMWAYTFALLEAVRDRDRYGELERSGAPADALVPGLRAHLVGCPTCAEEHESLRALPELDSVS